MDGAKEGKGKGVTRRVDAGAMELVRKKVGFGSVEGLEEQRGGHSGGKKKRATREAGAARF